MTNSSDDVYAILNGKYGLKYAGRELEAMREITDAHTEKSLRNFQLSLQRYENELKSDLIIKHHIKSLYENLLEQNLFRVIEPYSRVQINHIANQVHLHPNDVQIKFLKKINSLHVF
jgi:26S proteasome regulatory subunit N6